MQTQDVILPELRPKPHHPPLPRRYEETRPVIIQDFSHRRIIDLGNEFHRRLKKDFQREKQQALLALEKSIWLQANAIKEEALESLRKKLQAEHERTIRKISRAHEKTLQEELTQLKALLEQSKQDAVQQMKHECERKQQEVVQQVEQMWQKKLVQSVEAARSEERNIAAENAAKVAREHDEEIEKLTSRMNNEKDRILKELQSKCDEEKEIAIRKAKLEEQSAAEGRMNHFKDLFEKQVRILHHKIGSLQQDIAELNQEKNKIIQQRIAVQQELVETRKEFQRFIDTVYPFNKTDSRYVIPKIRSFSEANWLDDGF